jgi:hypothetical protein
MAEFPPQLRDRSITINHAGIGITWVPRDQLVPPSTRYTDTKPGPAPSPNPPPQKPTKKAGFIARIMQHLLSFFHLPKPTKVLLTGTNSLPPLRRKASFCDLWGKSQSNARGRGSAPSLTGKELSRLSKFACTRCKERQAKGERPNCFNYLCRGCGERTISVLKGGSLLCDGCAKDVQDGVLKIRGGWKREEGMRALVGPRVEREVEILRRTEEDIEASTTSGSLSSTKAVVGSGERDVAPLKERQCRKLKIMKLCGDKECGTVVVDGDEVMIKMCSEESVVLVSVEDHEPVEFNAAQLGSPTGLAKSRWLSPHLRASERARREAEEVGAEERPRLFRRSRDLPPLLEKAIRSPMASSRTGRGIVVPLNSLEDHGMQWNATNHPVAIPGRKEVQFDEIDLDISPQVHSQPRPLSHWMDLLEHPSPPSSLSRPAVLSVDSTFKVPESLADSEFCNELMRTLSNIPEGKEQPRASPTPTPSPTSPALQYFSERSSGLQLNNRSWSIESDTASDPVFPLDLPCEEHHAKLTRNHASTSIPTLNSFPKPSPSSSSPSPPPTTPSRASENFTASPSPLVFYLNYFDQVEYRHPHPEPERKRSPCLTPYPSLNSFASTLESGIRPTLSMDTDLNVTIHPPGCTPPPAASSPGPEEWRNESVSSFGTTPEIKLYKGSNYEAGNRTAGNAGRVERRGGGEKPWKERMGEEDKG